MDRGKHQSADLMRDATGTLVPRFAWPQQKDLIESDPQLAGIYAKCVRDVRWRSLWDISAKDGFFLVLFLVLGLGAGTVLSVVLARFSAHIGSFTFILCMYPILLFWHWASVRAATPMMLLNHRRCASCAAELAPPTSPAAETLACSACSAQWNAREVSRASSRPAAVPRPDQLQQVRIADLHKGTPYVSDASSIARPVLILSMTPTPQVSEAMRTRPALKHPYAKARRDFALNALARTCTMLAVLVMISLGSWWSTLDPTSSAPVPIESWVWIGFFAIAGIAVTTQAIAILRGRHPSCVDPVCKHFIAGGFCPSCACTLEPPATAGEGSASLIAFCPSCAGKWKA